jgi:hypothetical protein
MIKFLHNVALFWVKNANFLPDFFGENILKNYNIGPSFLKQKLEFGWNTRVIASLQTIYWHALIIIYFDVIRRQAGWPDFREFSPIWMIFNFGKIF